MDLNATTGPAITAAPHAFPTNTEHSGVSNGSADAPPVEAAGAAAPREPSPSSPAGPNRRGIGWFLLITFGGSWIPWAIAGVMGWPLSNPIVQLLTGAMMPGVAAVIVRRWITREGFADAGLRPRLRQSWRFYLAALLIPVAVLVVGYALSWVLGLWHPDAATLGAAAQPLLLGPLLIIATAPIFWGEEFGWTAYLRDRLLPGRPIATTFATGLIWAVWHWPLPWVGYFGEGFSATNALISMLLWVPLSILLEFLIGWLWASSGSVWPSAIIHGGNNLIVSTSLMAGLPSVNSNVLTIIGCVALVPFVAWVIIVKRAGGSAAAHGTEAR